MKVRHRLRNRLKKYIKKARWLPVTMKRAYYRRMGVKLQSRENGLLFYGNSPSDRYVFNEIFGPEDSYRREILLPMIRGKSVIDIGAHKGFFSLLASTVADRVLAFEPSPENYAYLTRNIQANGARNVEAREEAVSDSARPRTFTFAAGAPARHSFYRTQFIGRSEEITVACTTLASILDDRALGRIGLLKIDCEGGEYDILLSVGGEVFDRIDAIALEIHECEGLPGTREGLISHLAKYGFEPTIYDERSMGPMELAMAIFRKPVEA